MTVTTGAQERPSIIFILSDDQSLEWGRARPERHGDHGDRNANEAPKGAAKAKAWRPTGSAKTEDEGLACPSKRWQLVSSSPGGGSTAAIATVILPY